MPDKAIAALAALDLAMADTRSAYVARRVAELRLVASMVRLTRSSERDFERMLGAGLVPASSDAAAHAGIVSLPAVVPGSHKFVGVPAVPAPAIAVPPGPRTAVHPVETRSSVAAMCAPLQFPSGHSPEGTVDAARVVTLGVLSSSLAPPVDADPLPPAAAAALAALDRANADTPEAALARRIEEARLRASFVRSRRRSSDPGRSETETGHSASAAEAVAHASPSPEADLLPTRTPAPPGLSAAPAYLPQDSLPRPEVGAWPEAVQERLQGRPAVDAERGRTADLGSPASLGIAVRVDDVKQHGPDPLPQDALAALLALDLAMADTPAAYVARRIAEMQIRASIQRRIRPALSIDDRQAPSTPSEVAAGEPSPPRGIDTLPHAISGDPTSPMPSIDAVPRFGRDGTDAGAAPAMSDVERRRSWGPDRPRSIVVPDPGAVLFGHAAAGLVVPQHASMTETDPVGPGTADQSFSDLARLYHALNEERRFSMGDGTSRRAATPSPRHGVIDGIETPVTPPPHVGAKSSVANPVLPPSTGADASSPSQASAQIAGPVPTRSTTSPSSTHSRPAPGEVGLSPARAPAERYSTSGPAHQATTPSPLDESVPISAPGLPVDGIEIDFMDIHDIEDVLAAINAKVVPPKESNAPASDASTPPRSAEPAGQIVREEDISEAPVRPIEPETDEDVGEFAGLDLDEIDDILDLLDNEGLILKPLEPEPERSSPSPLSTARRAWRRGWDWMNGGPSEQQDAGATELIQPASQPASPSATTVPASRSGLVREAEVPRAKQAESSPASDTRAITFPDPTSSPGHPGSDRPATLTASLQPGSSLSKAASGPWVPERIAKRKRSLFGLLAFHLMRNGENPRFTRRIESLIELLGPDGARFATYVRDRIRNTRGSDTEIAARAGTRLAGLSSWADGLKCPVTRRHDATLILAEVSRIGGPTAKLAPVDPVLSSDEGRDVGSGIGARRRNRPDKGPER